MTFEAREESVQQGAAIELYDFLVYGVHHRFTTASEDVTILPNIWGKATLSRTSINEVDDIAKNDITISCAPDFSMLDFFDIAPPSDVILLTIYRYHREDDEVQPWWSGRVLGGRREDGIGKLHCENVYTSLKRTGLHRIYSRRCPHLLYGTACAANELLHRVEVTVDGYSGTTITSSALTAFADGRFAGGFIEWEPTPGRVEKRGIKSSAGNAIEITHPIPDLVSLETILVYKGCKHDVDDCDSQFNNIENYGGFPYIPQKNPMGQSSVF